MGHPGFSKIDQVGLRSDTESLGSMVDPAAATYRDIDDDILDTEFANMQIMQDQNIEITTNKK